MDRDAAHPATIRVRDPFSLSAALVLTIDIFNGQTKQSLSDPAERTLADEGAPNYELVLGSSPVYPLAVSPAPLRVVQYLQK